jgi:hypothetical protein
MPEIHTLKTVSNQSSKLYNWTVLSKAMELLGVTLDADIKNLIV